MQLFYKFFLYDKVYIGLILFEIMKKDFFQARESGEIERKTFVLLDNFADVENLGNEGFAVFNAEAIVPLRYGGGRKFLKHGPEVALRHYSNGIQSNYWGLFPVQLRKEAFDKITNSFYCGYTFFPIGDDKRKRKVSLTECVEGARIYAYANQVLSSGIEIKDYSDAKRVRIEGAEVVAEVPSRTKKKSRYKFKLTSVPIVDSPEKDLIVQGIGSNHSCGSKMYKIKYGFEDDKESSSEFSFCAHEIAAYLALVDKKISERNSIPLQMCPFAIPSQRTVNYYLNLENNVLVNDFRAGLKGKLRKLNKAEKEIFLWAFVKRHGYEETFFASSKRDGPLRDYNWKKVA